MDEQHAILVLHALSQPVRLKVLRLLVKHEPHGMAAGEIAAAMTVPQNTMSSHLAKLSAAGLVAGQRRSREIIYRAVPDRVGELASFLIDDCCGGRPELCRPRVPAVSSR